MADYETDYWMGIKRTIVMMKLWKRIKTSRDKRFLRRLERVLNENILEADILFRGSVGGEYDYIHYDANRGYHTDGSNWRDGWMLRPNRKFGQFVDREKNI